MSKSRENGRISALLIQEKNELILEAYFRGRTFDQTANIKSASKGILAILCGIAVQSGSLKDIDEPIKTYLPVYFDSLDDASKDGISIRHLLTMSSGLKTTSFGNYSRWILSDDWTMAAVAQPLEFTPGSKSSYSTGNSHLLSAVLTEATGSDMLNFAQNQLFKPMGIPFGGWSKSPEGYFFGGNDMALRPVDMLKIGQLVRDHGLFNGKRILDSSWVAQMTKAHFQTSLHGRDYGYGFYWWSAEFGGFNVHFAWGYGGQYIFIIPSRNMIVVFTSSIESTRNSNHNEEIYEILGKIISNKKDFETDLQTN